MVASVAARRVVAGPPLVNGPAAALDTRRAPSTNLLNPTGPFAFTRGMRTRRHAPIGLLALAAAGCAVPPSQRGGAATVPPTCGGDLGASAAAERVEAFVISVNQFSDAANQLNLQLLTGCRQMAGALEVPVADIAAAVSSPNPTEALCARAAQQLRDDLAAIRGGVSTRAQVTVTPPVCRVSVDAYAQCAAQCDATYTPGQVELQCEGGELRGSCSAACTGRCAVEVSGACNGVCEGTCSAYDAQGNCAGACQGRCVTDASATCAGECRGQCSVRFTEPTCTGRVRPPELHADCRAACDARLDARATCAPGAMRLDLATDVTGDAAARAARVQAAIAGGFRTVAGLRAQLERAARSGAEMARAADGLPRAVGELSAGAAACAYAASQAAASAVASVNVSVRVTVSVSASVEVR